MRFAPHRGSFLPVLMKLIATTHGSILELGCGLYSTNPLHWACVPTKRRLVTVESNPEYFDFLKRYKSDFHQIHCCDYDDVDYSEPWSIAFVDNSPSGRRIEDIKRLTHAQFVVAHDSENLNEKRYHYSRIFRLFKHRWKYSVTWPATSIFSNYHDLVEFTVK